MSLAVDTLELGLFGTNTYVVRPAADATDAVVVDPSGDATTVRRHLAALGAQCAAILVTHGHFDHVVGLADLAEGSGAPVYAPEGERILLEQPEAFAPPGVAVRPWTTATWLTGGETVGAAGIEFAVTAVPGHSPAHLAYFADDHLFSGDVLFAGSVGRTDIPGADWQVLFASIAELLDAYPPATIVHPGHGPATTLAAELERNPFLSDLRAARQGR
jgi:glyoxylase-like metal-dependent hydrolase (beta-lactamase superfamily II)